ncbi:MAG: hypothetical protein ACXVJG_21760 [Mucilaginibacter sp.]
MIVNAIEMEDWEHLVSDTLKNIEFTPITEMNVSLPIANYKAVPFFFKFKLLKVNFGLIFRLFIR